MKFLVALYSGSPINLRQPQTFLSLCAFSQGAVIDNITSSTTVANILSSIELKLQGDSDDCLFTLNHANVNMILYFRASYRVILLWSRV